MDYKKRMVDGRITYLEDGQIFVFGSNLGGRHGAGAAREAMGFGAQYGRPCGLQGNTYAIPTMDKSITRTLTIKEIKPFVDEFIDFAIFHPKLIFLVTEIGCGLAGLKVKDVAPLFGSAIYVKNIWLPKRFWRKLVKEDHE
jgi:hypothetical protein